MIKRLIIAVIAAVALYSCGTVQQPLYSWYDSQDATYKYTKRATEADLNRAMAQYELVINKQNGTRMTVPPGMNAEYGFLLCKAGKKNEGIALLKEEMRLYPESEKFISRIINQLTK